MLLDYSPIKLMQIEYLGVDDGASFIETMTLSSALIGMYNKGYDDENIEA